MIVTQKLIVCEGFLDEKARVVILNISGYHNLRVS
jgi:hypothetical protein